MLARVKRIYERTIHCNDDSYDDGGRSNGRIYERTIHYDDDSSYDNGGRSNGKGNENKILENYYYESKKKKKKIKFKLK